ncbi:hypothetical protein VTN00DRAFT_6464 [Thermoascus crustaceus]|uniref:uncharacterized protein n=1 Tax=Thermoascus crustaceus TaxID=5088 RepID=UPI003742A7AF
MARLGTWRDANGSDRWRGRRGRLLIMLGGSGQLGIIKSQTGMNPDECNGGEEKNITTISSRLARKTRQPETAFRGPWGVRWATWTPVTGAADRPRGTASKLRAPLEAAQENVLLAADGLAASAVAALSVRLSRSSQQNPRAPADPVQGLREHSWSSLWDAVMLCCQAERSGQDKTRLPQPDGERTDGLTALTVHHGRLSISPSVSLSCPVPPLPQPHLFWPVTHPFCPQGLSATWRGWTGLAAAVAGGLYNEIGSSIASRPAVPRLRTWLRKEKDGQWMRECSSMS